MTIHFTPSRGLVNLVKSAGCFTMSYFSGGFQTKLGWIFSGLGLTFLSVSLSPLHRLADYQIREHRNASTSLTYLQKALYCTAWTHVLTGMTWYPSTNGNIKYS